MSGGIEFDGSDDFFETSLVPPNVATLIGVANWDVEDQTQIILGARDSTNKRSYLGQVSSGKIALGVANSPISGVDAVAGDDYLSFGIHSGSTRLLSTNGSVVSDSSGSAPNNNTYGYNIGSFNTAGVVSGYMDGTIAEVIIYNSDQSDNRTAIEANIGETYNIDLPSGVDTGYDQVDGFVETWYDQSGNGNDAVQQVSGNQPKIVDAGVLVSGGIEFDGVDDRLTCPSLYSSDISIFNVATTSNTVNTSNYMRMIQLCDGSDSFQLTRGGGSDIGKLASKNTAFQSGTTAFKHGDINGVNLISAITSSTDTDAFVDGSLQSNGSTAIGSGNSATTTIGARDDLLSSTFFAGSHAELIIYDSDQSANREAIEANINNQYDIY